MRVAYLNLIATGIVFNIRASSSHKLAEWWHSQSIGDEWSVCLIEDQSWIDCIDITSRWDTFVLYHLYGNKGVSLPLWPIRPRWFHTFCPCAEPLGDGYEGMWARFGSQGSIALNWHSRYSGTRYSGTWLYMNGIFCPSVCPSICLSVTPFWICSHHRIIMKFPGVITNDKGKVHAKGQDQRSRSQRSQPNLTVSGL